MADGRLTSRTSRKHMEPRVPRKASHSRYSVSRVSVRQTSQHSSRLTFCTVYWMLSAFPCVEPHRDSPRLQRREAPFATPRRMGSFNGTVRHGTAPFPFPHVKHWPSTKQRVSGTTSLDEPSPPSPWCKILQWPPCLCHNSRLSSLPRSLKANGGHAGASAIQRRHEARSALHLGPLGYIKRIGPRTEDRGPILTLTWLICCHPSRLQ
jgi:hypothetical protein